MTDPRFKGATPEKLAKALLRPVKNEVKLKDKSKDTRKIKK